MADLHRISATSEGHSSIDCCKDPTLQTTRLWVYIVTCVICGCAMVASLTRLLSQQTILTRQKDKAEGFHELGCKTIIGNLQDYDLITEECKKVRISLSLSDLPQITISASCIESSY